jgi:flavin-dependent dehydrogenase
MAAWRVAPQTPELYFCRDLAGYGWCFRKGDYVNIGLGRLDRRALPTATAEFVAFLQARGKVPPAASWRWKGHAYLIAEPPRRRVSGTGMLLIGDAAGLAYAESGEGIRPAIESGLLAASAIAEAVARDAPDRLESYEPRLRERFGLERRPRGFAGAMSSLAPAVLPWLLDSRWFVRNLVLNRWFLHAYEPAMTRA